MLRSLKLKVGNRHSSKKLKVWRLNTSSGMLKVLLNSRVGIADRRHRKAPLRGDLYHFFLKALRAAL